MLRTNTSLCFAALYMFALIGTDLARAGHLDEAIKHADEAATAKDSNTVVEHTESAIEEIKAAAAGKEIQKDKAHDVINALGDLRAAEKNAHSHNTGSAINQASDAKANLEKAVGK